MASNAVDINNDGLVSIPAHENDAPDCSKNSNLPMLSERVFRGGTCDGVPSKVLDGDVVSRSRMRPALAALAGKGARGHDGGLGFQSQGDRLRHAKIAGSAKKHGALPKGKVLGIA